jgi:hypothetical protein
MMGFNGVCNLSSTTRGSGRGKRRKKQLWTWWNVVEVLGTFYRSGNNGRRAVKE